jgi:O-antigen ligase
MRPNRLAIKIVFAGIVITAWLSFFLGFDYGFSFFGIHWNTLDLALLLAAFLAIISFPGNFGKDGIKRNRFILVLLVALLFFLPILIEGVYRGVTYSYRVVISYGMGILWCIILVYNAFNTSIKWEVLDKWVDILLTAIFPLALFAITGQLSSNRFFSFNLDFYTYGILYLFSLGFLYYYSKIIFSNSKSFFTILRITSFLLILTLSFEYKKVIIPSGIAGVIMTTIWLSRKFTTKTAIMLIRLPAAAITILLVFILLQYSGLDASYFNTVYEVRYLHIDNDGDITGGRVHIWRETIELVKKEPIRGYGVGIWLRNLNPYAGDKTHLSSHNTFLHFFLALGIPGGLVFSFIVLLLLVIAYRNTINLGVDGISFSFKLFLFGSLISYTINSFFDMFTIIQIGYVLFSIAAGIYLKAELNNDKQTKPTRFSRCK